ncbi:exported hypothetical protein [Desulfosarcina cetonica]|uniref:hypothetical protein n=1 Tax=Desulfosarcina cetonica TaxID=90730 RepID=UPI0006CF9B1B|nr:hypothetical protein [Desulfosarcina cetonica]VTR65894.1 exported hypothetical protein [Desulfosarcina cetonica]
MKGMRLFLRTTVPLFLSGLLFLAGEMNAAADLIGITPYNPSVTVFGVDVDYDARYVRQLKAYQGEFTISGGYAALITIPGDLYTTLNFTYTLDAELLIDKRNNISIDSGSLTVTATIDDPDYTDLLDAMVPGRTSTGTLVASTELVDFGWGGWGPVGTFEFIFENNVFPDWFGSEFDGYAYVLVPIFNLSMLCIGDWDSEFGMSALFKSDWTAKSSVTTWVPIPASILLLGSGIGVLGIRTHRNRKGKQQ